MKFFAIIFLVYLTFALDENSRRAQTLFCNANYRFPQTNAGETATIPCSGNLEGEITRFCGENGVWTTPDYTNCVRTLRPGSMAVTQRNADGTDTFEIVVLDQIPAGVEISFTDNAILGTQKFRTNEGRYKKSFSRDLYPGEIIYINKDEPKNPWSLTKEGSFDLSGSGDEITIFTGSYTSVDKWIFNIYTRKTGEGYDTSCATSCDSNKCFEPSWMDTNTYFWITAKTATRYYGLTSGTRTDLLNSITNRNNWQTTESTFLNIASYDWYSVNTESQDIHCATDGEWIEVGAHETRALPCFGVSGVRTRYCNANGQWEEISVAYCNVDDSRNCEPDEEWPATTSNTIVSLSCPTPMSGTRTRKCSWNGKWLPVDMSQCNGDILKGAVALVQYMAMSPNKIGLVTTVTLPIGAQIILSDAGYTQNKELLPRENMVAYTVSDSPLPAGSLLVYTASSDFIEMNPKWRQVRGTSFDFDATGDNLFIFIGTPSSPYFVYGLSYQSEWQTSGSVTDDTTYLPTELEWQNRICALTVFNNDSRVYNGITSTSQTNLLMAIKNDNNWLYTEDSTITISSVFTIEGRENDLICPLTGTIPSAALGEQYSANCPSGTGSIIYTCTFTYPKASWNITSSTCTETPAPTTTINYPFATYELTKLVSATITPLVSGGSILTWTIVPTLPFGLEFNTQNGMISGIAQSIATSTLYTITGYDSFNNAITTTLTISVVTVYCQQDGAWVMTENGSSASIPCADTINYTGSQTRTCIGANQWGPIVDNCIPKKPTDLSYPQTTLSYMKNTAIETLIPTVTGIVTSWTVEPELPAGLTLTATNGYISGTPSVVSEPAAYTIYARNSASFESIVLTISVSSTTCDAIDMWPSKSVGETVVLDCATGYTGTQSRTCNANGIDAVWGDIVDNCVLSAPVISYSQSSYTFLLNTPVTPIVPTTQGIVTSYAITPVLPTGLLFDTVTGTLSGTPTVMSALTPYSVTASNSAASGMATFTITVVNSICVSDGTWPDTQVGAYAQLPCDNTEDYTGNKMRLCNNLATWETVVDNCQMVMPTAIQYNTENKLTLRVNMAMTTVTPTYTHIVTSWTAITPLPTGLLLNPTTGALTGTPSLVSAATTYQIRAANTHSNAVVNLIIEVLQSVCEADNGYAATTVGQTATKPCEDTTNYEGSMTRVCQQGSIWGTEVNGCTQKAPSNIMYLTNNVLSLYKGDTVNIVPTFNGIVTGVTVTPTLPSGLSIVSNSGTITGIPLVASSAISYTFTFSNLHKSTPVMVTISVQILYCNADNGWSQTERGETATMACSDTLNYEGSQTRFCSNSNPPQWTTAVNGCTLRAPYNINYPSTTYTWNTNFAITTITPTYSGTVTSWTINPALPNGLSISSTTGAISGTPTVAIGNTVFTINASNSHKSATYTLQITVSTLYCQPQDGLTQTAAGQTATGSCGDTNQYAGTKTYLCTLTNPPAFTIQTNTCYMKAPTVSYSSSTLTGIKHSLFTTATPSITGIVSSVTVSPALPTGLTMSSTTGAISGTPSVTVSNVAYTITFANADRNTAVTIYITITSLYCTTNGVFTSIERGETRTTTCGDADKWDGSQSRTCLIQNPPVWSDITSSCSMKAPYNINYVNNNGSIKQMTPITEIYPTYSGIVSSVSIEPTLPEGLVFNTENGKITGTPTVYTSTTTYTITLMNSYKSATYTLTFSVEKQVCESNDDFPETAITRTGYSNCVNGQAGVRLRLCTLINNIPTWGDIDTSNCVVYGGNTEQPVRGYQYLRIISTYNLPVSSLTLKRQNDIRYVARDLLADDGIQLQDIVIESVTSTVAFYDDGTSNVVMRINVPVDKKETIQTKIVSASNDGTYATYLKQKDTGFSNVQLSVDNNSVTAVDAPILTTLEIVLIAVGVVLVVVIIVVIIILVTKKSSNKKPKLAKVTKPKAGVKKGMI
ncbi:hypothetical protein WA158_004732 [Blastocystis sp. Blastoise]